MKTTLVIVDNPKSWPLDLKGVEVVPARKYLTDPSFTSLRSTKVFNLCRSYRYQTVGYYVSLLAEARGHKPFPRFDRNAIEIRIVDIQECPEADLAIAALLVATLRELVAERFSSGAKQRQWATADLAAILDRVIKQADGAVIDRQDYLALFGLAGEGPLTSGEFWRRLLARHRQNQALPVRFLPILATITGQGCLARRMLRFLAGDSSRARLTELVRRLCRCLEQGIVFAP